MLNFVVNPIALVWSLREEADVVALAHHDHGDLGLDAKTLASS